MTDSNRHPNFFSHLPDWLAHVLFGAVGVILLVAAFSYIEQLNEFDLRLAGWLREGQVPQLSNILLIDVPQHSDPKNPQKSNIPEFRSRLVQLLKHLAKLDEKPALVALDIGFDPRWGEANPKLDEQILEGLKAIKAQRIPVYGTVNVLEEGSTKVSIDIAPQNAMRLYEAMDGFGHNLFERGDPPFYQSCLPENGVVALPLVIGKKEDLCEKEGQARRFVHFGPPLELAAPEQLLGFDGNCPGTLFRRYGGDCLAIIPDLGKRIVIVGDLTQDRPRAVAPRTGPEAVAWAINDLKRTTDSGERTVLVNRRLHLVLLLVMPMVGLLLFAMSQRFVRRWRLKPWRLAVLSAGLSMLLPLGLVLVLRAAGADYSQVMQPTLSTLLVIGIAAHYRGSVAYERARRRDSHRLHEHVAYDIFISYRHNQAAWVKDVLLPKLRDLRNTDGEPLSIFFDDVELDAVRAKGDFNRRLEVAIYESRIFLPVLTPDYFVDSRQPQKKTYCYHEMRFAQARNLKDEIGIVPLMHSGFDPSEHGHEDFPALKDTLHGYFTDDPEWSAKMQRDILAALVCSNQRCDLMA